MREKRRSAFTRNLRVFFIRGAILAGLAGVALGMATQSHSVFDGFIHRHTPTVEVRAAKDLAGLPLDQEVSAGRFGWWFPWARWRQASRWRARYPAVKTVRFDSDWRQNRVVIQVASRTPIVLWNGSGLDGEGVVFSLAPGLWPALPKAQFSATIPRVQIGRWLAALAHETKLWGQVVTVADDGHGFMQLSLQSGALVLWGPPEAGQVRLKVDLLTTVLDDAHAHLGGASTADLRFFDDARIIVRPKSRWTQAL